jgi:aspartokinase-like uncharacterized kinase
MAIDRSPLIVIKVGGSLFDLPELPERLSGLIQSLNTRVALIAGGGRPVDVIRALDALHGLGEERSHQLALAGLDFTAQILAALAPSGLVALDHGDLELAWGRNKIPVLAAGRFLLAHDLPRQDALPASWQVTSDSIAARIATILNADRLVLAKSAPLAGPCSLACLARHGLVDPCFPGLCGGISQILYCDLRTEEPRCIPLEPS